MRFYQHGNLLLWCMLSAACAPIPAREEAAPTVAVAAIKRADFGHEEPPHEVRKVADWVVDASDNRGLPFVIVNKVNPHIFVFAPNGQLLGSAPALVGIAHGDDSVPGIGERKLSEIRPEERTTPAGRFVAEHGSNAQGEDILWVDYDNAVSLHRVRTSNPAEHRLERLASHKAAEHRISYGCINVPAAFYDRVVDRALGNGGKGVIYVLPEVKSVREVFGMYDVDERERQVAGVSNKPGNRQPN